jgi:AraC-like DNA-binding protein
MNRLPEDAYVQTNYFAKIRCEPGWVWRTREQPFENYDLFYVWDGVGTVTVNGEDIPVRRGSCLLFRPGDRPGATHDPRKPLTLTYIHFNVSRMPELIPERSRVLPDPLELEAILDRYVRLRLAPAFGSEEETRLLLKQMMILLLRSDRPSPRLDGVSETVRAAVMEIANYIREHPAERFTIAQLAARAGLSPKYFSRMFTAVTGESVQTFTVRTRLERAAYLLRYGGMNVSEVADALGYRDVFFFSRQFRRHTGKNPSSLR